MKSTDFLIERVVNLFTTQEKLKYADEVWALFQRSYAKLPGGFGSAANVEELVTKTGLWKLVTRNGEVTAANVYRDQHGRKSIAAGTNGSKQGLRDYLMVKDADIKLQRVWAEVSGAPEHMMKKAGCKPVPAKFAPMLTKKHILSVNDDGFHYTRLIAGSPHEKIIYGSISLSAADVALLDQYGILLHELPENIKIG